MASRTMFTVTACGVLVAVNAALAAGSFHSGHAYLAWAAVVLGCAAFANGVWALFDRRH